MYVRNTCHTVVKADRYLRQNLNWPKRMAAEWWELFISVAVRRESYFLLIPPI